MELPQSLNSEPIIDQCLHDFKIRVYFDRDCARYEAGSSIRGFITVSPIQSIGKFEKPVTGRDTDTLKAGKMHLELQIAGVMIVGKNIAHQNNIQESAFMKTSKDTRKSSPKQSSANPSWELLDNFVIQHMRSRQMRRSYDTIPDILSQDPKSYYLLSQALELMYRPPPHFYGVDSPSYDSHHMKTVCNSLGKSICKRYLPVTRTLMGENDKGAHAQLLMSSPVLRLPEPELGGPLTRAIAFSFDLPTVLPPSVDRGRAVEDGEMVNILYSLHVLGYWDPDPARPLVEHADPKAYRYMREHTVAPPGLPWSVLPAIPHRSVSFSVPFHVGRSPTMFLRPMCGLWRSPHTYLGGSSNDVWCQFKREGQLSLSGKATVPVSSTSPSAPLFTLGAAGRSPPGGSMRPLACENLPIVSSLLNAPSIRHITGKMSLQTTSELSCLPLFDFKPMRNQKWTALLPEYSSHIDTKIRTSMINSLSELVFPCDIIFDKSVFKQDEYIKRVPSFGFDVVKDDARDSAFSDIVATIKQMLANWNPWNSLKINIDDLRLYTNDDLNERRMLERQKFTAVQSPVDLSRMVEVEAMFEFTKRRLEESSPSVQADAQSVKDQHIRLMNQMWMSYAYSSIFNDLEGLAPLSSLESSSRQLLPRINPKSDVRWDEIDDSLVVEPTVSCHPPKIRKPVSDDFFYDKILIKQSSDMRLSYDETQNYGLLSVECGKIIELNAELLPPNPNASIVAFMLAAHGWIGCEVLEQRQAAIGDYIGERVTQLKNKMPEWLEVDVASFCGTLQKTVRSYFMTPGVPLLLTFNTSKASIVSTQADISLIRSTYWVTDKDKKLGGVPNASGGAGFLQQILGVGLTGLIGNNLGAKVEEVVVCRWPSVKLLYSRIRHTEIVIPTDLLPTTFYSDAINVEYHISISFTYIAENTGKVKDEVVPQLKKVGHNVQPLMGCPYPPPIGLASINRGDSTSPISTIGWNVTHEHMNVPPSSNEADQRLTSNRPAALFDTLALWAFDIPIIVLPCGTLQYC
eukprot:GHVH01004069.1.p1 GENE.GHVH01004069.1~~GHVH01004069.1.p1  ORF type:complete len:1033 (+),score=124.48 GHVH01004069.1:25-3099(+)